MLFPDSTPTFSIFKKVKKFLFLKIQKALGMLVLKKGKIPTYTSTGHSKRRMIHFYKRVPDDCDKEEG